jgi:hypothetical protein
MLCCATSSFAPNPIAGIPPTWRAVVAALLAAESVVVTPLLELVRPLTSGEYTARHVPSGLGATLDRQAAPPCMRTTLAAPDCREEMLPPKRLRHGLQVAGSLMS